jgi:hypothetical protein
VRDVGHTSLNSNLNSLMINAAVKKWGSSDRIMAV